jgi:hypothetical protein
METGAGAQHGVKRFLMLREVLARKWLACLKRADGGWDIGVGHGWPIAGRAAGAKDLARVRPVSAGALSRFFYTFRKSPLLPKARDVAYRQRKCLSVLAWGTFGVDLNRSESELKP